MHHAGSRRRSLLLTTCLFALVLAVLASGGVSTYAQIDSDGDTIPDEIDNCPLVANPDQTDTDGDGIGDVCDDDDDNDGSKDAWEDAAGTDPLDPDTDDDNWSDGYLDPDGGGPIQAGPDCCPLIPNPSQIDNDGDTLGDPCDDDDDDDGILDDGDNSGTIGDNPCKGGNTINCDDNCRLVDNPGQEDSDGDGVGDSCFKVLLVHGWQLPFTGPGCDGMSALDDWLEGASADYWDPVRCFGYNSSTGVIDAASLLKQYLEGPDGLLHAWWGLGDEDQIHIVAHSMGGLVARYYIEELEGADHVKSLTMLGTPNKGVWFAILGWLLANDRGARDCQWGSSVLHRLNDDFPPPELSTRYLVIAGTGDHSPFYWDTWFENDCIVSVNSARGPDLPVSEYEVIHTDLPGWLCGTLPSLLDSESVFQAVLDHVNGAAAMSGPGTAMVQSEGAAIDPDVSPLNGMALDSVDQGEMKSHPVWVDASSGQAAFTLFWAGAETSPVLQLTLEDPDGTIIDGSTTGVTYAPAQAPGYGGILAEEYLVDAPDTGEWQMRVEGISIAEGPHSYVVVAYLDSGVSLSAWLDETTYGTGDPMVIAAAPEEDGSPILGASISAAITKPNGLTDEVALVDDGTGADPEAGDGDYWGTLTDTSQCGVYEIDVSASGTASEGEFTRQEVLLADAHVAEDAAGDPCNADDDADGLTDAQEVDDYLTNPLDPDTDADDVSDGPDDPDGEGSIITGPDNCSLDYNPGQADSDGDGTGDVCDSTPFFPVGGIAELPDVSGSSGRNYVALAGLVTAAVLALTAGAWYARRRWLA